MDPFGLLEDLERAIGVPPAAILAIILLAGPTTVWLLYRFVVQPRTSRFADSELDLLWICERCHSANEVRAGRCYRCGLDREAMASGDLKVVDRGGVVTLTAADEVVTETGAVPDGRPMVPVGPGRPDVAPDAPPAEEVPVLVTPARRTRRPRAETSTPADRQRPE
jgi:hypothetical protein